MYNFRSHPPTIPKRSLGLGYSGKKFAVPCKSKSATKLFPRKPQCNQVNFVINKFNNKYHYSYNQ